MTDESNLFTNEGGPPAIPPPMLGYAQPGIPLDYQLPRGLAGGQWQEGNQLVMHKQAEFLPMCVKCGAEPDGRTWSKKYAWHHPAVYAVILLNLIIYAIVALCVQQKATVTLYLCSRHRARRNKGLLITWLLSLGGIATMVTGAIYAGNASRGGEWIGLVVVLAGIAMLIAAIIVGNVMVPILRPKKIDREYAWFTGVAPEYLAQLPEARPLAP